MVDKRKLLITKLLCVSPKMLARNPASSRVDGNLIKDCIDSDTNRYIFAGRIGKGPVPGRRLARLDAPVIVALDP